MSIYRCRFGKPACVLVYAVLETHRCHGHNFFHTGRNHSFCRSYPPESRHVWAHYGLDPAGAPMSLNRPGIISIPLSFDVIVVVSLATSKKEAEPKTS